MTDKQLFTVDGKHYPNKRAAKLARGERSKEGNYRHVVKPGPDHWKTVKGD